MTGHGLLRVEGESVLKELKRFLGCNFLRMELRLLKTRGLKSELAAIVRGMEANRSKKRAFLRVPGQFGVVQSVVASWRGGLGYKKWV